MSSALSGLPDFLQDDFHAMESRAMSGSNSRSRFSMISAGILLAVITLAAATGIYFWKFNHTVMNDADASLHVSALAPQSAPKQAHVVAQAKVQTVVHTMPAVAKVHASTKPETMIKTPAVVAKSSVAPVIKAGVLAVAKPQPVQTLKLAMSMQSFVAFNDGKDILSPQAKAHVHDVSVAAKNAKGVHLRGFAGRYTKKNSSLERLAFSRALAVKSVLVDDGLNPRNIRIYRNNNVRSYLTRDETLKNPARVEISIINKK